MAEIQTTKDVVIELGNKIDKLITVLKPVEKQEKDVSELIDEKFKELGQAIEKQIYISPAKQVEDLNESIDNIELKEFNRSRLNWFIGGLILTSLITYLFFYFKSLLFLIPGGIALAFIGLLFNIFVDWKGTPGDSYAKISRNPVAIAIFMLIISIYFAVGVFVAQQYIPESFSGEASQRIDERLNNIEKIINQEKEESKEQIPETPETDDGEAGNNGIPNR